MLTKIIQIQTFSIDVHNNCRLYTLLGIRRSHLIELLVKVVKYLALPPGIVFFDEADEQDVFF